MTLHHVNLLDQETAGPGPTELNYLSVIIVIAVIIVIFAGVANVADEPGAFALSTLGDDVTIGEENEPKRIIIDVNAATEFTISWGRAIEVDEHAAISGPCSTVDKAFAMRSWKSHRGIDGGVGEHASSAIDYARLDW